MARTWSLGVAAALALLVVVVVYNSIANTMPCPPVHVSVAGGGAEHKRPATPGMAGSLVPGGVAGADTAPPPAGHECPECVASVTPCPAPPPCPAAQEPKPCPAAAPCPEPEPCPQCTACPVPPLHRCSHPSEDLEVDSVVVRPLERTTELDEQPPLSTVTVSGRLLSTSVTRIHVVITPLLLDAPALAGNTSVEVLVEVPAGQETFSITATVPTPSFAMQFPRLSKQERVALLRPYYYDKARYPYPWAASGGSDTANDRNNCMDFFGRAIMSLPQPLSFVELGSGEGAMLAYIAALVKGLSPRSKVLSVELKPDRHERIKEAMQQLGYGNHTMYFTGDVTKLVWQGGPIGAIFTDVNLWAPTAAQLLPMLQYLVVGGYIGFHDTYYSTTGYDDYRRGIRALLDSGQYQVVSAAYLYVLQKVSSSPVSKQSMRVVVKSIGDWMTTKPSQWYIQDNRPHHTTSASADCVVVPTD